MMRKLILILALSLLLVPNLIQANTARLEYSDGIGLLMYCNFSNYTTTGYNYTLYKDDVVAETGYSVQNGTFNYTTDYDSGFHDAGGGAAQAVHPWDDAWDENDLSYTTPVGGTMKLNFSYNYTRMINGTFTVVANNGTSNEIIPPACINYNTGIKFYAQVSFVPDDLQIWCYNTTDGSFEEIFGIPEIVSDKLYEERISVQANYSGFVGGQEALIGSHLPLDSSGVWSLSCQGFNATNTSERTEVVTEIFSTNLSINILDEITGHYVEGVTTMTIISLSTDTVINYNFSGGYYPGNIPLGKNEIYYETVGYYPRRFYIVFSASSDNLTMYVINTTDGDRIIHTVYDENGEGADNLTVHLLRQYGADYTTVSMSKTNFEGETVLSAELYDINYRMMYYTSSGTLISITTPSPFLGVTSDNQISLDEDVYFSWRGIDNIYSNVSIYNDSGVMTARFIYTDDTGLTKDGCLIVKRLTPFGLTNVCYNCTSASSAVLTCIIDHTIDGEYQAYGLIETNTTNSWYTRGLVSWKASNPFRFGREGIFLAMMIVGTLGLLGIASITGSVLLLILGLAVPLALTLVAGYTFGLYVWVCVLGMIILYLVRKVKR